MGRNIFLVFYLLSGAIFVAASAISAFGQPTGCSVRDRRDFTVIVICPKELSQDSLRNAGLEACGSTKPCAAWIWVDEQKAPAVAPKTPEDFSRVQIVSAVAIWVNEDQKLITISPVEK